MFKVFVNTLAIRGVHETQSLKGALIYLPSYSLEITTERTSKRITEEENHFHGL